jgi:transposase
MAMLADTVDGVIGVDTDRDTLAAAAVTQVGGVLALDHHQRQRGRRPAPLGLACSTMPGRRVGR